MACTVRIAALTTCEVSGDGTRIQLDMVDEEGQQVTLELRAALATPLILTLPRLMEQCLQRLHGDATRLVFPMGRWALEAATEADAFILSLETPDGFRVAFAVSMDDASGLADALQTYSPGVTAPRAVPLLN